MFCLRAAIWPAAVSTLFFCPFAFALYVNGSFLGSESNIVWFLPVMFFLVTVNGVWALVPTGGGISGGLLVAGMALIFPVLLFAGIAVSSVQIFSNVWMLLTGALMVTGVGIVNFDFGRKMTDIYRDRNGRYTLVARKPIQRD